MKLAVISAKFPYGPHEPYLHAELRALAPYFDRITVFPTSPNCAEASFRDFAAGVRRLGILSGPTAVGALRAFFTRPRQTLFALLALLATRSKWRVKIKNIAVIPLGLAVGDALRRGGYDHVHSYWLSTPSTVAYLAAQVAGIPWSSTGHQWDIYEDNALRLKLSSALFVRAISARGRAELLKIPGIGCRATVAVVHVGVDLPEHLPERRAQAPDRPFALLCAANLVAKKGHLDLVHAIALLRSRGLPVTCKIAGEGILRNELQLLVNKLGITSMVTFRGNVEHETLLDEMRSGQYDAMILASREFPGGVMEGIPVALMEAMAAGIPVISTKTGSITELVDEHCGCIVPQSDSAALAAAIEALAGDQALREQLTMAAFRRIRTDFNVLRVGETLAQLIGAPVHEADTRPGRPPVQVRTSSRS